MLPPDQPLSIAEASRLMATRDLSPVELVKDCLRRISAFDRYLNSFITVTAERALADARAAEGRMMSGQRRGHLDGIPIAHKDLFCTAGVATTASSKLLQSWVPHEDAFAVGRLADAGACMLGKVTTHEFALGGPPFDLPWPPARNPWNIDHYTAGSSSGTAVAVAAGLVLGGTATDTAGSIRAPASMCGVVGLKPTFGLCSRRGVIPLSHSLDHVGPIAQTVEDCALLLQAMAGHDVGDRASVERPATSFLVKAGSDLKGLRVGVLPGWLEPAGHVSNAVLSGVQSAVQFLHSEGAEIVELHLPPLADYHATNFVIMTSEAFGRHEMWMRSRFEEYGCLFRRRMVIGSMFSDSDYVQALRRRHELCFATAKATAHVDVLVTAGAPREAPRIDSVRAWGELGSPSFYAPFNTTGWPAICVGSGYGEGGMPVAVQFAAKPFEEQLLLRVAHAFECAISSTRQYPDLMSIDGARTFT